MDNGGCDSLDSQSVIVGLINLIIFLVIVTIITIMVVIQLTTEVKELNGVETYYMSLILHITHSLTSVRIL